MAAGFGSNANREANSMKVYKHALYVGTYNSNGCEVWEYNTAGI